MSNPNNPEGTREQTDGTDLVPKNPADTLAKLHASTMSKEDILVQLKVLKMIRSGESGNEAEFAGKTLEELKKAIQDKIDELDPTRKSRAKVNAALTSTTATTSTPETPESAEKPEALTKMIADMERTATAKNKFYNFGTKDDMLTALNSLPKATVQAIEDFAGKLKYRRTRKSFPILVDSKEGNNYILTESAASSKNVNINAAEAKELVNSWGFSSPNNAQWAFLKSLRLVDLQDVPSEWLPSETASTDAGYAWFGFAYYGNANQYNVYFSSERRGVRALRNVAKA